VHEREGGEEHRESEQGHARGENRQYSEQDQHHPARDDPSPVPAGQPVELTVVLFPRGRNLEGGRAGFWHVSSPRTSKAPRQTERARAGLAPRERVRCWDGGSALLAVVAVAVLLAPAIGLFRRLLHRALFAVVL